MAQGFMNSITVSTTAKGCFCGFDIHWKHMRTYVALDKLILTAVVTFSPQTSRTLYYRFIRFFFSTLTLIVSILFFGLPSNQIRQQALVSYKCFVNSDFRQPVRECFESSRGSDIEVVSVIFLCQNVYFQGKIMRTLSLNAAYLVLFKNPRDKLQITTLGKQMYPGKTDQFLHKYEAAVERPYGYLFVDLKPNTPEECRLRTNVLPNDPPQTGGQLDAMKTIGNFFQRQGYLQSPVLKAMQNLEEQMDHILKDPSVPPEVKVKEYTSLFNRYLHLEQQLPNSVVVRPRQEAVLPPLADESHLPAFTTPENVPSTSLTRDSGFVTSKPRPSMLQRLTSKIRITSTSRPSTSVEVPSTPIRTHSEMGQPTSLFNTPNTPSGPPIFPPTPPPSKEKPIKWIPYRDAHKYDDVVTPPRRSERLRAVIKSIPNWQKY
ncbi:hypothetical protein QZH41_002100 [Actinostola sp. cb2023]|nr:hypothetical protein QZH41_002100 [Actinostola sp. cb2023]